MRRSPSQPCIGLDWGMGLAHSWIQHIKSNPAHIPGPAAPSPTLHTSPIACCWAEQSVLSLGPHAGSQAMHWIAPGCAALASALDRLVPVGISGPSTSTARSGHGTQHQQLDTTPGLV